MLSLEGATYRHAGASADTLHDVTLEMADGTLTGLLGRSGAGLSTLCLVLGGMAPRVTGGTLEGTLRVDGVDVTGWPMHRLAESVVVGLGRPAAQLSMVAETVFEEVAFGPSNLGLPRADVLGRTEAALETLALTDLATRDPRSLSGGEQQLVVIAGLLAMGSRHLVLDAPIAHLDRVNRAHVLAAIEAAAAAGRAVLVAEHRQEAFAPAGDGRWDALLAMAGGRLVAPGEGAADSVVAEAPPHPGRHVDAPDIRLEDVSFRYPSGVTALEGVDLRISPGEAVGIVGANGSGKTTLVQHLDGLLRPTRGRVRIGGEDSARRSVAELARSVALAFQDPDRQIFARSVAAEVGFGPRQLGRSTSERERSVESAIVAVGLQDAAGAHPADLGTSQRKLLSIASLLAMECPVLVLDEPTAGLDDDGARVIERVVAAQHELGRTVVAISHDERFVARSFERVVRLEHGRVRADGSPARVLSGAT